LSGCARVASTAVVGEHRSAFGVIMIQNRVCLTRRWRQDGFERSAPREEEPTRRDCSFDLSCMSLPSGTEVSNPLSSSGESLATSVGKARNTGSRSIRRREIYRHRREGGLHPSRGAIRAI
jgi:hypothetical protein